MKSCSWLSLVTRVFIVFTVSPSIIPPLLLFRVLSHFLSSLHFCRFHPLHVWSKPRNIRTSGAIREHRFFHFFQVFSSIILSWWIVLPKIIYKSTLDAFLIYSFYFLHITSVNPALSILFIFSPSLYLFSSLFHSLYSLYYNIYSILPCYLSSSTYHLCHYPIFSSFLYSIFYIFYYKY